MSTALYIVILICNSTYLYINYNNCWETISKGSLKFCTFWVERFCFKFYHHGCWYSQQSFPLVQRYICFLTSLIRIISPWKANVGHIRGQPLLNKYLDFYILGVFTFDANSLQYSIHWASASSCEMSVGGKKKGWGHETHAISYSMSDKAFCLWLRRFISMKILPNLLASK